MISSHYAAALASYHNSDRREGVSDADLALESLTMALYRLEDNDVEFDVSAYQKRFLAMLESLNHSEFTLRFTSDKEGPPPPSSVEYHTMGCLIASAKECDMVACQVAGRASPKMLAGLRRLRRTVLIGVEAIFDSDVPSTTRAIEDQLANNFVRRKATRFSAPKTE